MTGTTPQCDYVGGHANGFDVSCAWCVQAKRQQYGTAGDSMTGVDAYRHDHLAHVVKADNAPPCWAVLDYGTDPTPQARVVAMFYRQDEAAEYSEMRRRLRTGTG